MAINEICLGCKKLCKKLAEENAKDCPDYDPRPKKKEPPRETNRNSPIIINKRR